MNHHFEKLWAEVHSIQYGFNREEAEKLFELALSVHGLIVEVGSMQGGSARILEASGNPVVCIDPIENPLYYEMFQGNVSGRNISHRRVKDYTLWAGWTEPIALLLIDHDHSYDSTLSSLLNWRPHMSREGIVCVHDYGAGDWPYVKPAVDDSGLSVTGRMDRLVWGRWFT